MGADGEIDVYALELELSDDYCILLYFHMDAYAGLAYVVMT